MRLMIRTTRYYRRPRSSGFPTGWLLPRPEPTASTDQRLLDNSRRRIAMPSLYEDIKALFPELHVEGSFDAFLAEAGDNAGLWSDELKGTTASLDNDWRKIVFQLLDHICLCQGFVASPVRHVEDRLNTVVHPVSTL